MSLPPELESAVLHILDGAEQNWGDRLDALCAANPAAADSIRAHAATVQAEFAGRSTTAMSVDMPDRIGPFRILAPIGAGGMGAVYRAEQVEPVRREVALKLIKLGMDSASLIARFEHERQALAVMEHEGIAKVFDCGTTDRGQPWFAMELVKGVPIDAYCREHALPIEKRLELVRQVCGAVQHAHQKGIVHRDLKPGNVLVVEDAGEPHVKIIDFGLAKAMGDKLVDATLHTELGAIVGTLEFMAPEQADPSNPDIDTRADVYAIGVLLYQLLVDELPFPSAELRAAGLEGARRILREVEPPKPSARLSTMAATASEIAVRRQTTPSALRRVLGRDLDWVVLKAMAKDRQRRYEHASALAEDLGRYLESEPVLAGPPSVVYRLQKLWKRRKGQVIAASLVGLTVLGGSVATLVQWLRAEQTVEEFNLLAGVSKHERAIARQAELYPAWPRSVPAMEAWLRETCEPLLSMRDDVRRTIQKLREPALEWTEEQRQHDLESHEHYEEWVRRGHQLEALRRAHAVRTNQVEYESHELSAEHHALDQGALVWQAWTRVAPREGPADRTVFGEEALGLALARRANERSPDDCEVLNILAWALLANGLDDEARRASADSRAAAPPDVAAEYEAYRREFEEAVRITGHVLAEAETVHAELTAEVKRRRTFEFAPDFEASRFLHDALVELSTRLDRLETDSKAAVERRLEWARNIETLTFRHPMARVSWSDVREYVRTSERYRGKNIEWVDADVLGLVPLGANPVTRYLEFYHLRSAWDGECDPAQIPIPQHSEDGSIDVTASTGIVFVLLPGATAMLGSQNTDSSAPLYDHRHQGNERVHEVELDAYFIARHEMTIGQWSRLWGGAEDLRSPSYHYLGFHGPGAKAAVTAAHPVERVSWLMARELLRENGLVIPTEAQWEYACRATTTTPWHCDESDLRLHANLADAEAGRAWPGKNYEPWEDGHIAHAPVGSYQANGFGLFDMHGNVYEHCRDCWGSYGTERAGDGLRPSSDEKDRVYRGGSFYDRASHARAANRFVGDWDERHFNCGLRPARAVRPRPKMPNR